MTIGEVLDALNAYPRDRIVILSKDGEGNAYSPLADLEERMYLADSTWSGDVYLTPENLAKESNPDEYAQAPGNAVRSVVLWPVN